MKSLAHPDWPYSGTPWEWRGFVKAVERDDQDRDGLYVWNDKTRSYVYQKQNFGPDLD